MRITTENLSYSYGENDKTLRVKALSGVSVTVNEGEFFGIIGQTGSGKSTFVFHLNGLIRVQKGCGAVYVGDYDLTDKKCDFKSLRAKVGMVFQYPEYQLFAETVRDDVAFGLKNSFPGLSDKERAEKVRRAIETVGLDYAKVAEKSPFELSGGQKRRAANPGDYFVIRECAVPAVLVECGFLSNAGDEKRLQDAAHQQALADAICAGVLAYMENRS